MSATETKGRLQITPDPSQPGRLVLAGSIDETAAVAELAGRAVGKQLILDLSAVTFINSLGVRDWIRLQQAATKAQIAVELQRVSEPLVHQLNMIIATRGDSRVISFYAPYACDSCGREESVLVDAIAHGDALRAMQPPPATCPECKSQMAFNDFPERYFSFLVPG